MPTNTSQSIISTMHSTLVSQNSRHWLIDSFPAADNNDEKSCKAVTQLYIWLVKKTYTISIITDVPY